MRRVMFTAGLVGFATLFLAVKTGYIISFILAIVFLIAAVLSCIFLRSKEFFSYLMVSLCTATIFFCSFSLYTVLMVEPIKKLDGKTATIEATVIDNTVHYGNYSVVTIRINKVSGIKNAPKNFKTIITTPIDFPDNNYQKFKSKVTFVKINSKYMNSDYSDKIYISAGYVDNYKMLGYEKGFMRKILDFREKIINQNVVRLGFFDGGLINAILTGNKTTLDNSIYYAFSNCGITHIMAVSGLHLSILCFTLLKLLTVFGIHRKLSSIIVATFSLFVAAFASFTPSILRAAIMFIIYLSANWFSRKRDGLNSIGIAAVILLLYNPYFVISYSFILSCLSLIGIIVFTDFCEQNVFDKLTNLKENFKHLYKFVHWILLSVFVTVGATITTMPVIMICFGRISIAAVAVNLLVCPVLSLTMGVAVLAVFFSFFYYKEAVADTMYSVLRAFIRYIETIVFYFNDHVPTYNTSTMNWTITIMFTVFLISIMFIINRHNVRIPFIVALSTLCFVASTLHYIYSKRDYCGMNVLDVGNDVCAVYIDKRTVCVFADITKNSTASALSDFLDERNIYTINMLVPLKESNADNTFKFVELRHKVSDFPHQSSNICAKKDNVVVHINRQDDDYYATIKSENLKFLVCKTYSYDSSNGDALICGGAYKGTKVAKYKFAVISSDFSSKYDKELPNLLHENNISTYKSTNNREIILDRTKAYKVK